MWDVASVLTNAVVVLRLCYVFSRSLSALRLGTEEEDKSSEDQETMEKLATERDQASA